MTRMAIMTTTMPVIASPIIARHPPRHAALSRAQRPLAFRAAYS